MATYCRQRKSTATYAPKRFTAIAEDPAFLRKYQGHRAVVFGHVSPVRDHHIYLNNSVRVEPRPTDHMLTKLGAVITQADEASDKARLRQGRYRVLVSCSGTLQTFDGQHLVFTEASGYNASEAFAP